MKKLPIDTELLTKLSPGLRFDAEFTTAKFWLSKYFKGTHTLMFETPEEAKDKAAQFFLPTINSGGSTDGLPINVKGVAVGTYDLHNGGLIHLEFANIVMPLLRWEEEYIKAYNDKYQTTYLTFRQAYKLHYINLRLQHVSS